MCFGQNEAMDLPKGNRPKPKNYLEVVSIDASGIIATASHGGSKYFVVFVDHYTGYVWVYLMKSRTTAEYAKIFERWMIDAGGKPKTLCMDGESALNSKAFKDYCRRM